MAVRADYAMNEAVAARWEDGLFYLGRVIGRQGNRFAVAYADGDQGWATADDLVPIPRDLSIAVGSHVLACWQGARMFTGVVRERGAGGYVVVWDDGDPPLLVPVGQVTYVGWITPPVRLPPVQPQAPAPGRPLRELSITLPGAILPTERGERFVEPLMDALTAEGLGHVVEEGTSVKEVDGRRVVTSAHVYVAVPDHVPMEQAAAVVVASLRRSGAPAGTVVTDGQDGRWVVA